MSADTQMNIAIFISIILLLFIVISVAIFKNYRNVTTIQPHITDRMFRNEVFTVESERACEIPSATVNENSWSNPVDHPPSYDVAVRMGSPQTLRQRSTTEND